jgi:hypothetical protein
MFKVSMKLNNSRAIYKLKTIFGVGKIHLSSDGCITYKITHCDKIKSHIIPLLDSYPFRGQMYFDYLYFKQALNIFSSDLSQDLQHELLLELKHKSKIDTRRINPIFQISSNLEHLSNLEIIDLIPRDLILNLFDP